MAGLTKKLLHHREPNRLGAANTLAFLLSLDGAGPADRFAVFVELLGGFEVLLIGPGVVVFAVLRGVLTANLRPGVVNAAQIVRLQMPAGSVDQQIPGAVIHEDRRLLVQQIPADVVVFFPRLRRINGEREVPAALGGAVVAQAFPRPQILAAGLGKAG